ncbi:tetratricopeptide repeat protein [Bacteroides caecicola]|uniref:tetratricopeptide repeat protein n=1 Tax=Bacteroides caecicola TaxID=1462569 RepID=UPI002012FB46|nr:tetratricopeptide repeat protein [Bacteroides caecicola]MCL1625847.1 tetratricopeptide repeat protein [Bacteroides caecicola]
MKRYLILAMLFCCSIAFAQNIKRPDSYNYSRGVEAIQNNNAEEALEYLNKELEENPDNGYALAWIAVVRNYQEEYGRALTAADLAIKHIPRKDKEYKAFSYIVRAEVYVGLGENEKALADFTSAVKETPDDANVYEKRADLYYYMEKYDLADKDYQKIISIDPGNVMGYMGIGRNANAEKRYEDAIEQFSYVTKLASDYSSGYSFRAESLIGLKKYDEAIDDIIHALDIDYDNKAFYLMQDVADSAMVPLVAKLKIQSTKNPNNDYWLYCLGAVYENKGAYKKAITYYTDCQKKNPSSVTSCRISNCYSEIGDYASALQHIDNAIALDSTDYDNVMAKADILYESGEAKAAILELSKYVAHYPEYYGGYYRRGWYKDNSSDVDGAIEDYTMAIVLQPDYAYAYLGRGDMYALKGDKKSAEADYKKVIELDTIPGNSSCTQYAYLELGQKEKAVEFMNNVIEKDPDDAGNYYDAACLHSRMGELDKSIEFLQTALEKGFRRFSHLEMDDDLDAIRELPKYKELIRHYKSIFETEIEDKMQATSVYEEQTVEIPFSKEDGVCKVKCTINNLPLYFVFDTGASDVSLSSVEATFMMKNGYLKSSDVIGKQNYMMANGEISAGTVINLRNVNFGGLDLDNIRSSVVHNQTAPLLLGQSILGRLGSIEIDNAKRVLRITYKKKVEECK